MIEYRLIRLQYTLENVYNLQWNKLLIRNIIVFLIIIIRVMETLRLQFKFYEDLGFYQNNIAMLFPSIGESPYHKKCQQIT